MTSDGVIHTEDGEVFYEGPFMTIQQLAEYFEVSDSTAHKVVRTMRANGQIRTVGVLDPVQHCRRLWVIPAVRDE
jgi:hypothetical protein